MPITQTFKVSFADKGPFELTRDEADLLYNELRDALGIGAQVVETPLQIHDPPFVAPDGWEAQTLEAIERRIAQQQVAPHQSGNSVGVASTGQ